MSTARTDSLPLGLGLGYGVGMVGAQIFRDAPALLLMYFLTNSLGVAVVLAGIVITIPKIWVIFVDPMMGAFSDKTKSPWGRRRPYLFAGALLCGLSFLLIFNVPDLETPNARAIWVCVMYTIALTGLSIYSIPYFSVAAEISDSPKARTQIVAYRIAFMASGLIASSFAPVLVAMGGDGAAGYAYMSYVLGAICAITMMIPFFALSNTPLKQSGAATPSLKEQVRLAVENRPFLWLLSANFIQRVAEGAGYAAIIYFVIYRLQLELQAVTMLIVAMSMTAILAQPMWVKVSEKFGKVRCYWFALPAYCAAFAMWAVIPPQNMFWVYVLAILNGLFNSGFLLMAQSMLTDTIAWDAKRTGMERAGAFSGLWLANEKVAFTVGAMITAATLGAFGFVAGTDGAGVEQTAQAIQGIVVAFVFTPIVFHLSSLLLLKNYKLDESELLDAPAPAPAPVAAFTAEPDAPPSAKSPAE